MRFAPELHDMFIGICDFRIALSLGLVLILGASALSAKTYSWSAAGTEISYQIDIKPEWNYRHFKKFNHGIMSFHNREMKIHSESLSQAPESLQQTLLRRVAKLSVGGKIKRVSDMRKLGYPPWPYIYHIDYKEGDTDRHNLEALWHFLDGRRIVRVVCSAEKEKILKI